MEKKEMEKHIDALRELFPNSFVRDSVEFDGHEGGMWTGFGEDGTSNFYRAGWPDEHDPKLQKYLDDNDLWTEWHDAGTLMIYPLS